MTSLRTCACIHAYDTTHTCTHAPHAQTVFSVAVHARVDADAEDTVAEAEFTDADRAIEAWQHKQRLQAQAVRRSVPKSTSARAPRATRHAPAHAQVPAKLG